MGAQYEESEPKENKGSIHQTQSPSWVRRVPWHGMSEPRQSEEGIPVEGLSPSAMMRTSIQEW